MLRALPLLLLALLVHACTSPSTPTDRSPSAESTEPARITLIMYRDGRRLSLINEAHGQLGEYNSQLRENADTKISYNEILEGLIWYYEENGFFELAVPGRAPLESRGGRGQALEVESSRGTFFLMPDAGMTEAEVMLFHEFRQGFIEGYNITPQLQSVVNPTGKEIFQQPEPSDPKRR